MGYSTFDDEFGQKEEIRLLELFRKVFDSNLKKTTYKYAPFDFESEHYVIELKSRRCAKDTYPTSMVNCNKIRKMELEKRLCFIVFNYTDGVYFWKYDSKEALKAIEYKKGGRTDRGFDETKMYCFIDNKYLLKIVEPIEEKGGVEPTDCFSKSKEKGGTEP